MQKNCFTRLIILGIICLSLMTIGCGKEMPVWGDLQTGLILKYRIPKDQALTYKTDSDTIQNLEAMGRSIETAIKYDARYSIKGTGIDDQNNLVTQININDINVSINGPQGNTSPDTSNLKGKSFGATYSTNGKRLKVTGTEDLPKIILGPGTEMDVKNIFEGILPRLPDSAIKTGESWTTPFDKDVQQGQISVTMKGESSNVLEGVETIQGMECVKIKTQSKYTVEGSGTQMGQALNLKGDGMTTSIWYFAYKKGLLVKLTSTADANIKINLGTMEIPQTTKTKADTKLVL